jgi:heme/copper-type cytochrome/quinol oxidase subunit 2
MAIAVIAIIVAVAALAMPYAVPATSTTGKTGSPQTREFYLMSSESTFDTIPSGLNHYIFTPPGLTVNQGDKVTIHFYNTADDTHHTFTLPAYNINVDVAPDSNQDISFTATQAGVFIFTCSFHAPTMRGELTVLTS